MSDKNFRAAQRARWVLVVAAVVGIIASATLGLALAFGSLDIRNTVAPFAACMAIGYVAHAILTRRLSGIDDAA